MVPVTPGAFVFDPGALVKVRNALGLSQAQMAARLGVPQNTVSRWETGATTPDAHSLAAVYSVAQKVGLMATFFKKAADPVPALAACYWDMATVPVHANVAAQVSEFLTGLMEQRAQRAERSLRKVFSNPPHDPTTAILQECGWGEWQDEGSQIDEIIHHVLSDIGHDPGSSVVFLVTANEALSDLVEEARRRRARVYVVKPGIMFADPRSSRLVQAAGQRSYIELPQVWPIIVR